MAKFRNAIAMTAPGTKLRLEVLRNGKTRQVEVTVGKQKADAQGSPTPAGSEGHLGLTLQALTPDLATQLGYQGEKGALVVGVEDGSPAAEAGIERGDLIQEVNRKPVSSPQDFGKALQNNGKKPILLLVRHGDAPRYVAIRPE